MLIWQSIYHGDYPLHNAFVTSALRRVSEPNLSCQLIAVLGNQTGIRAAERNVNQSVDYNDTIVSLLMAALRVLSIE